MNQKFEITTLILRIVLGITFFVHGLDKFQGGIENIVGWFASIGLPGFLAYGVALIELVGGILLIIGLASRVVSGLLAVVMIGAILKVQIAAGFLGGYELDLALLTMAVAIAINGSKLYAVDQLLFKGKKNQKDSNAAA